MLDLVSQQGFTESIEKSATTLCASLREMCAQAKVAVKINQVGSMWTLFFAEEDVFDHPTAKKANTARFAALHHALLERGVYLPPSQFEAAFLSSEHGSDVIDQTANAFREALKAA